jgi:hypothetical protein
MASWSEVAAAQPEFARVVRGFLDAHVHKTLATLRRDGSPRISGTEVIFFRDDLWIGSMPRSRKALDLRRDPRFALHSGSADPPGWKGDAKLAGRFVEVEDAARAAEVLAAAGGGSSGEAHVFRAEISEASVVRVGEPADHLVIELWKEGEDLRRMERR